MMPSVAFHTLGCKVNFYDTEAIWQMFKGAGYDQVDFEETADVYVVNTCTVTNTGDKKSRQMIRRAIRRNPEAIVAVTGCYAQTAPNEIMDIGGVDLVIGTQDREKIIPLVKQLQEERQPINAVRNIMKTREFEELDVPEWADRTRAFLKIQEGCNNFCTFCIIPWTRGLSRSRAPESVIAQARKLVASGYREIVLTGIHTGGYGDDLDDYHLADLLWDLDKVEGLGRIRISSIEASQISDEVIEVLQASDKMCRHLHIPIQAAHDEVLKKMKRKYTVAEYAEKIKEIQRIMPDVAITTDVIVGFPGETVDMFEQSKSMIEQLQFAELHVFPYSQRSGTPAAKMDGQVEKSEKDRRVQEMIDLSERLQLQYAERFIDNVVDVIPEKVFESGPNKGFVMGHSDNYLQVVFQGSAQLLGKVCRVKIKDISENECRGSVLRVFETPEALTV